ncbi:GTP cyclohydrolase II [Helicobacter sp. 12S02232-10]|uniref:GTP cyclohydrolase II n=1 Tax=Helicobacter sp. 12S02232-10 TaxID=1476197 RepID=UPI000BA6B157|nr:GTP cyclohydrolase II [Helicobacter sp. 12S02232-10]PAF46399.1 GTP cyclohydrolase II [Helicobacter sp. 12S02232-10]
MEKFEVSNRAKLPTRFGDFFIQSFREFRVENDCRCPIEHLVAFTDPIVEIPLVRVHSECLTGDVFGSQKCDCGGELAMALEKITQSSKEGQGGMLIYLRQEGRGIGLFNKVNAYALQDKGYDTVEANEALGFKSDNRDYSIVGDILKYYGIKKIRLLTNNPRKITAMSQYVEVIRDSIIVPSNCHNEKYLATKKSKLGHLL